MAKKTQERGAKSAAVRDYLATNPSATAKEVVEALAKKGITVSAALVSSAKGSSGTRRRRGKDVDLEKEAMRFAFIRIGSLDKALKAVEQYSEDETGQFIAAAGGKEKALSELRALADQQK